MVWKLREGVRWTSTEYGGVLLDTSRGKYYAINGTAATVLDCLLAGDGRAEAMRRLAEEYDVAVEATAADVAALITELESEALLVRR